MNHKLAYFITTIDIVSNILWLYYLPCNVLADILAATVKVMPFNCLARLNEVILL